MLAGSCMYLSNGHEYFSKQIQICYITGGVYLLNYELFILVNYFVQEDDFCFIPVIA